MATKNRGNGSKQPTAPHFFKVIVAPFNQGVRIPTQFMRRHGHLLGKRVVLKAPTGDSWRVELRQAEDGTWLDKGWLPFTEHFGVGLRHFLVFRYEGNSQFHVLIFKPSTVEIQYPFQRDHFRHEENHPANGMTGKVRIREEFETHSKDEEDDEDDDVSVEFLGEESAPSRLVKKRGRPPGTKKKVSNELTPSHPVKKRGRPPGTKKTVSPPEQPANPSAAKRKKKGHHISYLKAKAFRSANPCIVRLIYYYHVNPPFRMTFALGFARDNLPNGSKLDLMFCVQGSMRCWPVICHIYSDRAMCKQGWKRFVQDNRLRVGDACVFELVNGTLRFNTLIYRNNGRSKDKCVEL